MEINTKDIGKIIKKMDMVYKYGKMEKDMKVNGEMEKCVEKEFCGLKKMEN